MNAVSLDASIEEGIHTSNMSRGDENERTGPNAPLLASDGAEHLHEDDYDSPNSSEIIDSGLEYSGSWFIWVLTFSAGISGLLFGYEYVRGFLYAHGYSIQWKRSMETNTLGPKAQESSHQLSYQSALISRVVL